MEITVMKPTTVKVAKIKARCGVRYWEDGTVNGVEDTEGDLIPLRQGDDWCPTIDVEPGRIEGWPGGTTASVHYKVCDDGRYALVGEDGAEISAIEGYVPSSMSPKDNAFGDYVIMDIGPDGTIDGWAPDLTDFLPSPDA